MDNASRGQLPTGRTTNLSVANQNVIMTSTSCLNAHLSQHQQHHIDKTVEGKANLLLLGDERQHQIITVSIHTASPTLSLEQLDAMRLTVFDINLILNHLVAPIDHAGLHLPQKESIVSQLLASHKFLHGKIERQSSCGRCFRRIFDFILIFPRITLSLHLKKKYILFWKHRIMGF